MTDLQAAPAARPGPIRIGFVPLCDCAPLVMAQELGLFEARGLRVELSREIGWATIRDKIVMRELDAAHAPAAMVPAISLGIGSFAVPCVTGLVLNLHGNGITLSNRLWTEGVRDGASLGEFVRSRRKVSLLTFGVAFACSSHNFLLQQWLRSAGLSPMRDVNVVVVPPPQMAPNLKAGNLDGYCVGEPWNSLAVEQHAGWVTALSSEIAPRHPEKVLLVRADFANTRAEEHEELVAALLEACQFCQRTENRQQLAEVLAGPRYLNTRPEVLQRSLCGPFAWGREHVAAAPDLHLFSGPDVNEPTADKAAWVRQSLSETGLLPKTTSLNREGVTALFRSDVYQHAARVAVPQRA